VACCTADDVGVPGCDFEEGDGGKSDWNGAGVAFANRDGSFTLKLDILPQTKFQLREEHPATKAEAAAE